MREEVLAVGSGDVGMGRERGHGLVLDAGRAAFFYLCNGFGVTVGEAAHRMQSVRWVCGCDPGERSDLRAS